VKRVLSAAVFLPAFWVIVKKLPPAVYEVLMIVAALLALVELYRFAAARGQRCHRLLGAVLLVLVLASFIFAEWDVRYALLFGLMALPLACLRRGGDWGPALSDVGTTFFISLFIGVLFGYLIDLRTINDWPKGDETGSDLVFLLFFIVWSSDTAAYYVGTSIGRRPLAPKVSPKKTVEGAVGGILGALLAAFVAKAWFINRLSIEDCAILGLLLGCIGILGDLVESMFKRGAGMKDSAALVPGHGGILDRVDSLLYAGPVLYYYYLFAMRVH
jgi:phosphatidate cytidylyltransferase